METGANIYSAGYNLHSEQKKRITKTFLESSIHVYNANVFAFDNNEGVLLLQMATILQCQYNGFQMLQNTILINSDIFVPHKNKYVDMNRFCSM